MTSEKIKEYQRAYRAAHKEAAKSYNSTYLAANREKLNAQSRAYYAANQAACAAQSRAYYAKNKEACRAQQKEWYDENGAKYRAINRERCLENTNKWRKENGEKIFAQRKLRYHKDSDFRLRSLLRNRIYKALSGVNKSARTRILIGCSLEFLWSHLEKQFATGMTRENYGRVWHVDHILPCAKFHLQHSEEQEICFHWTNLQPLFSEENLTKNDKII